MSASKRPSTSSLRRFISSRAFVTVAELRRRFGLDEPDAMALLRRDGTTAWIGLPEREAGKLQDLWDRNELGVQLSVEVRAPVVVGVYPMRIARYVVEAPQHNGQHLNGSQPSSAVAAHDEPGAAANGANGANGASPTETLRYAGRSHPHAPRPMNGAPTYQTDRAASRQQTGG